MTTDEKIKTVTAVVALAGLLWGVYSFIQVQAIGAAKPYLERKLAWCEAAVETTSRIATADPIVAADVQRFWQMYWGVMGLIEKQAITNAMVDFGEGLAKAQSAASDQESPPGPPKGLTTMSLALAHACRTELSLEWSANWSRQ